MKTLPQSITNATFLMLGTGDGYQTVLVHGSRLLEAYEIACFGEVGHAPKGVMESCAEDFANLDNWCLNPNYGPVFWKDDFEDGSLQFIRITEPLEHMEKK